MHQVGWEKAVRWIGVSVGIGFILLICLIRLDINAPGRPTGPHRVRLVRRYPTDREIIGPTYHEHRLPPVHIDLKAGYDRRRQLVQHGRPKLQARSAALARFRRRTPADLSPADDTRRYLPLPPTGDGRKLNLTCDTCSLVANSGNMRLSSLGEQIDAAECVFRMDAAPTVGYERDVGRRTTVRVVSYASIADLSSEAETLVGLQPSASHMVFYGPDQVFGGSKTRKYLERISDSRPDAEMFRTGRVLEDEADFEFLKHTGKSRVDSGSEFSSDLYALLVTRDVCSSVTVYGMLPRKFCLENPGSDVSFKYYKDPQLTVCSMLDYHGNLEAGSQPLVVEKQVFEGWREGPGGIGFVHPTWE